MFLKVHHGDNKYTWWNLALANCIKQQGENKSTIQCGGSPIIVEATPDEVLAAAESGATIHVVGAKPE